MSSQKRNEEYEFLVLLDFSKASYIALKYVINLAKIINLKINILHVIDVGKKKNKTDLISNESAESVVKAKLSSIVDIIEEEGIHVSSTYIKGSVNDEIKKHLLKYRLNDKIVVIGKSKNNTKVLGNTVSYLLHEYSGTLLVVGEEREFHHDSKLSVGSNGKHLKRSDLQVLFDLDRYTTHPLSVLNIENHNETEPFEIVDFPKVNLSFDDENLSFEYLKSSTVAHGLIEHIYKEAIDLFCIGREKTDSSLINLFINKNSTISKIVKATNIPILIVGGTS